MLIKVKKRKSSILKNIFLTTQNNKLSLPKYFLKIFKFKNKRMLFLMKKISKFIITLQKSQNLE